MSGLYSAVDRFFRISERGSNISNELKGGLVTFLSVTYILSVTPAVITEGVSSVSWNAVFTSTAVAIVVSCVLMGLYARLPIVLGPSTAMNAFLAYNLCLAMGFTYPQALLIVFLSGLVVFLISVTNVREKILDAFPSVIRYSMSAGIGLFIILLGLYNSGIIVHSGSSPLALGDLSSGTVLLALFCVVITLVLWFRGSRGAILVGILLAVLIGVVTGLVALPSSFIATPDFSLIGSVFGSILDFPVAKLPMLIAVVFAMSMMALFDASGTLLVVTNRMSAVTGREVKPETKVLTVDSASIMIGAASGTSSMTSYIESCIGVEMGARTGLAAVFVAMLFVVAMLFGPVFGILTSACITGVLVLVGVLMMSQMWDIVRSDKVDIVTGLVVTLVIGCTGSITDGVAFGVILYVLGKVVTGRREEVSKIVWLTCAGLLLYEIVLYAFINTA